MPKILFTVNYQLGLSELCKKYLLKRICWEIDYMIDEVGPLSEKNESAFIFTYRENNVKEIVKARLDHVQYLPMAADNEKRKPITLTESEESIYSCPVSFKRN